MPKQAKEEIIMTATNVQDLRKILEGSEVQQYLDWKENSEGKCWRICHGK